MLREMHTRPRKLVIWERGVMYITVHGEIHRYKEQGQPSLESWGSADTAGTSYESGWIGAVLGRRFEGGDVKLCMGMGTCKIIVWDGKTCLCGRHWLV